MKTHGHLSNLFGVTVHVDDVLYLPTLMGQRRLDWFLGHEGKEALNAGGFLLFGSHGNDTLRYSNIAMENGPVEDVFPIEHGDIPLLC